jgi:hypothetical protein
MRIVLVVTLCILFFSAAFASSYTLEDNFSGDDFFNNFQFFTGGDPTHGIDPLSCFLF